MLLFATNAQVLDRYDGRWIGKNILDNNTAATIAQLLDLTTPDPSAVRFQTLLGDASEILMSAAAVGARYAVSDLVTYGGNLLINITAGLGFGIILKRRGRAVADNKAISDAYTEAKDYLEQLREGHRIFALVPNVPQAGLPQQACMTPIIGINPPDLTQMSGRYFGQLLPGCCSTGGFPQQNPLAGPPGCGGC